MYKNIAIILLACCCIFLLISQRLEIKELQEHSITVADYGGLIALRDVLPPEEYEKVIVPFLEQAAKDGNAAWSQLLELEGELSGIEQQAVEAAKKIRPQEELAKLWESAKQGASDLGSEVNRNMREAVREFSRMLDEAVNEPPSPVPSSPAQPQAGAAGPAQI